MLLCEEFIRQNKLFKNGEIIGVGCSGGSDSIALLHYLSMNQEKFDIEVVAIHVDHGIRENSYIDADFVREKAREFGVRFYKFRVDAPKVAAEKGLSVETAAREVRYGVFKSLIQKGVVDKIALAHHVSDQAETILMHIFRGAGTAGARGMSPISEGVYVRPFLNSTKEDIIDYLNQNHLDYVDDQTNVDTSYNRNFVRHVIMKDIKSRWPNAEQAIVNFAKAVKEDDEFIQKQVYADAIMQEEKLVKIPTSYFIFDDALVSRIIFKAVRMLGINQDVEKKHIDAIKFLATKGDNGKRVFLPFDAIAVREYDYITIYDRRREEVKFEEPLRSGEFEVPGYGKMTVKRVKDFNIKEGQIVLDWRKVPKDAVWRFRQDGDVFTKFGGGTKKLKSFMIDKKIPARIRDYIPVLASGNEIFAVAGYEISEKVKVEDVPTAYMVELKKN